VTGGHCKPHFGDRARADLVLAIVQRCQVHLAAGVERF
jgi:hypothetical protein